ncbi:hypothetical protein KP509_01G131300 [Ceratopteris richardii]|nr:hypothetical protein KP509_01G131300 [Ceratopteris richardii]KAH7447995.1 hypothetical protein KP509_01G131300 [Ceratopteris richardii]KAH7447996.1 hypothetical protein KP509_01G131300 [Ceratopteris richardii]
MMELWNAYPRDSDFGFAEITPLSILPWEESYTLGDHALPEAAIQESLIDVSTLPALDMISDYNSAHLFLNGRKTKAEISVSARTEMYRSFLEVLRKKFIKGFTSEKEASTNLENPDFRLSELLKYVVSEIEHNVEIDNFKTESSECIFWVSVQNMARKCGVDFREFEKFCDSPEFKAVSQITGNVSTRGTYSLSSSSSMTNSLDQFQELPPMTTTRCNIYTTTNTSALGQPKFLECQRIMQPLLCNNLSKDRTSFTHPDTLQSTFSPSGHLVFQNHCSTFPMPNKTPKSSMRKSSSQCFTMCLGSRYPSTTLLPKVSEICRKRTQRQRKRAMSYNHLLTNFAASTISSDFVGTSDLQFLLEKELKPSDVGSLGRIILPKRQAEDKLPHLEAKEGLTMYFQDMQTSQIWTLKYRFWPNNKTRMYLLESTGSFVKLHELHEGDFLMLYKNLKTGNYMIDCRKATWPKCLTMEHKTIQSASCESGPSIDPTDLNLSKSTEIVPCTSQPSQDVPLMIQLPASLCNSDGNDNVEHTDITSATMWDADYLNDLVQGFSEIGTRKSIDELFNFKV